MADYNSTYSSIRIYVKNGVIKGTFFDIIGVYGESITDSDLSGSSYTIDIEQGIYPVIQSGDKYYYLAYNASDGYSSSEVAESDSNLHVCLQDIYLPIYLEEKSDANLITNSGQPLNISLDIKDKDNQKIAYRTFYENIYDDYAIKYISGSIIDNGSVIDKEDPDFNLIATNPDKIISDPEAGSIVSSLYSFKLTFPYEINTYDESLITKVALYNKSSKSIEGTIDIDSIEVSGQVLSFNLKQKIISSGVYLLYLPTNLITYSTLDNSQSSLTMLAYTVRDIDSDALKEYIISPTSGQSLSKITITYPNVSTVSVADSSQLTTVITPDNTTKTNNRIYAAVENVITVDLSWVGAENTSNQTQQYSISIPANTILIDSGTDLYNDTIDITYNLLSEDSELPSADNKYVSYRIDPVPGTEDGIYSLAYFNIYVLLSTQGVVTQNINDYTNFTVTNKEGTESVSVLGCLSKKVVDEGDKYSYEFDISLPKVFSQSSEYTVNIPAGFFLITYPVTQEDNTVVDTTYLSTALSYTYKIVQGNTDHGSSGGGTSDDPLTVNYYYKLISLTSSTISSSDNLVFKPDNSDTLIINRDDLSRIFTTPYLSITTYDPDDTRVITSKKTLESNKVVTSLNVQYYDDNNSLVTSTADLTYKTKYNLLTDILKLSAFPNYITLSYTFDYDGQSLSYEIELQIVPRALYTQLKENINLIKSGYKIDLYTGSDVETQYGTLILTNDFDCIQSTTKVVDNVKTTYYKAELEGTTKVRIGNLDKLYNIKFGTNQPTGFGLYGESVFLTGNFYLDNGKSLLDISNDILLATGDTKAVKESLSNLESSIKQTISNLTNSFHNYKVQLDDSIENYISANKNSVLKIGLDYSLWALGNAGIALINPNAKYIQSDDSGELSVDPDTVGDGDEYISLQGEKVVIKTYSKESVEDYNDKYKIIYTKTNPKNWQYDANKSIFLPKDSDGNSIKFYIGCVSGFNESLDTITDSNTNGNILREVAFYKDSFEEDVATFNSTTIPDSSITTDYATYSFRQYYHYASSSLNYANRKVYVKTITYTNSDNKTVTEIYDGSVIPSSYELGWKTIDTYDTSAELYYVPMLDVTGLFENGKFNADLIETKNLVAVDEKESDGYEKNPKFDPKEEVSSTNYPVIKSSDGSNATESPFVVVSGTTGKITAKDAKLTGSTQIGEILESDYSKSAFVYITGSGYNEMTGESTPGLYILRNKQDIISKFSGIANSDPLDRFTVNTDSTITKNTDVSVTYSSSYTKELYINDTKIDDQSKYEDGEIEVLKYSPSNSDEDYFTGNFSMDLGTFTIPAGKSVNFSTSGIINFLYDGDINDSTFIWNNILNSFIKIYNGDNVVIQSTLLKESSFYTKYYTNIYNPSSDYTSIELDTSNKISLVDFTISNLKISNSSSATQTYTIKFEAVNNFYVNGEQEYNEWDKETVLEYWNSSHTTDTTHYFERDSCWKPTSCPNTFKIEVIASLGDNFSITATPASYSAEYMGNGIVIGYDPKNYFTTYFDVSEQSNKNQMILDFQSNGAGMKFSGGDMFYAIKGAPIQGYIPILQGIVSYVDSGSYYKFDGVSLISKTYKTDGSSSYGKVLGLKYADKSGYISIDTGTSHTTHYSSNHDIYLSWIGGGDKNDEYLGLVLNFGSKWLDIFNSGKSFLSDTKTFVQATGRGRGGTNASGFTSGPIYVTVRNITGETSSYSVTYTPNGSSSTSNYSFHDWIQFFTSDDATTNHGSFYITISYCPNA